MIQIVKFLNNITLKNGDVLRAGPIVDSHGQLIPGEFLAEVKKVSEGEFKVVPIGRDQ